MTVGRWLTELRRSSAAGIHGKFSRDRYNKKRAAMEEAMLDVVFDEDREVVYDEEDYDHTGALVDWERIY